MCGGLYLLNNSNFCNTLLSVFVSGLASQSSSEDEPFWAGRGFSLSPRSFKFNLDEYSNWGWEARARPERGRVRPAWASQLGRVYLGHSLKLDQWNLWNIQRLLHNTRPSQPHSLARVARGRGSLALCHRGWPLAPGGSGYASLCGYAGVCRGMPVCITCKVDRTGPASIPRRTEASISREAASALPLAIARTQPTLP